MDFGLTDEQQTKRDEAVAFAEAELNDDLIARNRDGAWSWDLWRKCADFGLLGLVEPTEYGGQAVDPLTTLIILEGIGYGCKDNGLPFALNSQIWSVQPAISKFGTDDQKRKYLPPLIRGDHVAAFGISELGAGSDSYAMKATATKTDGGYVLNGTKAFVTFAPIAEVAVVFASTNTDRGRWGISGFIVDKSHDGFTTSEVEEKMGLRTTPFGKIHLDDCFVPSENLLGNEGSGVAIFSTSMESERSYIFASQVGRMQRQIEECAAYAKEREAFGTKISKFESVADRIVNMQIRLETARTLLYKVAWLEEQGISRIAEAAMAKLYLSECFVESSLDAIRIHGARGYATEYEVERDLRDSIGGLLYSGTSDIQRRIIAEVTGL